jgi:acetate---CoA ligase (ADP-forming)
VNPRARTIGAHQCYAAATEVPEPVDLAVIAVPAAQVEPAVDDCVRKGDGGRIQEARLRDKIRAAGIRMIGPNCLAQSRAIDVGRGVPPRLTPARATGARFRPCWPTLASMPWSPCSFR